MSYVKTLKNGEIQPKNPKKRKLTPYDKFMAKRKPSTLPYQRNLVLCTPKNLFELQKIIEELKLKRGVLFDLKSASAVEHQRMLDYLSGAVFALGARLDKIDYSKYLITPRGMDISTVLAREE